MAKTWSPHLEVKLFGGTLGDNSSNLIVLHADGNISQNSPTPYGFGYPGEPVPCTNLHLYLPSAWSIYYPEGFTILCPTYFSSFSACF